MSRFGVIPLLVALVGCSGAPDDAASRPTEQLATGAGGDGGGGSSPGVGGSGGSDTGAGGMVGDVPVIEVPDGPCTPATAESIVLAPGPDAPYFDRLAPVGTRWLVTDAFTPALTTFDDQGAGAMPLVNEPSFAAGASEGSTIAAIDVFPEGISYRRRSETGQPNGAALAISTAFPMGLSVGAGGDEALVVWGDDATLRARGIAAGAPVADSFVIEADAYGADLATTTARSGDAFAVAWTGIGNGPTPSVHSAFAKVSTTGILAGPIELPIGGDLRVIKLVPLTSGYVLLVTSGAPSFTPYLLRLDASGQVVGAAAKLAGAAFGWDVAAGADDAIGVVARRASGEPELRVLDATLAPRGAWVCLDGPGDLSDVAAVAADGDTFAVVHRTTEGASVLRPGLTAP